MSASIGKMLYGELEVLLVNVSCAFYPFLSVVSSCLLGLTLCVLNVVCHYRGYQNLFNFKCMLKF